MARPRKDDGGVPAQQRLEDAFWAMLAEAPYREMTMGALARRAQVNHNTFYYYFDNLDAMAAQLLDQNLVPALPARLLAQVPAGVDLREFTDNAELMLHFRRMCLLVGPHGAAWMADRVKQAVLEIWLTTLGLDQTDLDRANAITLTWIIGGLIAVLGQYGQDLDPAQMGPVIQGPLGQGVLASLARLKDNQAAKPAGGAVATR
ncbi:MAG: TetR/AcrR family transcriptional regulator [Bifidobacteriaceae bacterium]|jgi:AcrR family transcriptional regulator|nr:TetR/AcrR family transcriptional regulator [Bifidobacteriaceae bacterium]